MLRAVRRASIVGGAGTGKTILAAEKARRLAKEGFRTLLVCFNSALAGMLAVAVEDVARDTGLLDVKTFHQLCEDLGREAGVLGVWMRVLPLSCPCAGYLHGGDRAGTLFAPDNACGPPAEG